LVRQLTTAGFRPKSKYEYIVPGSQSVNLFNFLNFKVFLTDTKSIQYKHRVCTMQIDKTDVTE